MVLNWSFPHDFVVAQPSGPSTSPLGGGRDGLQYRSALTCPNLADAVQFYVSAFGFSKVSDPVPGVVILHAGNSEICLLEKRAGSRPSSHTQETRRYERHWTPDPPQSDRCWAELRQGRGHPSRRAASDSSVRSGGGATGALRTHARYMRVTHTASRQVWTTLRNRSPRRSVPTLLPASMPGRHGLPEACSPCAAQEPGLRATCSRRLFANRLMICAAVSWTISSRRPY